MPCTLLFSFLGNIPGAIGQYFSSKNELEIAKIQTQMAMQLAAQQAASASLQAEATLEKSIVESTSSYFKYFTFLMWFSSFYLSIVAPSKASVIFQNLSLMPQWYCQSCMVLIFAVWGISAGSPVISSIFGNLTQYLSDRRQDKIEMIKAKVDPKNYFDVMRQIKGHLSDQDVKDGNAIVEKLNSENKE